MITPSKNRGYVINFYNYFNLTPIKLWVSLLKLEKIEILMKNIGGVTNQGYYIGKRGSFIRKKAGYSITYKKSLSYGDNKILKRGRD